MTSKKTIRSDGRAYAVRVRCSDPERVQRQIEEAIGRSVLMIPHAEDQATFFVPDLVVSHHKHAMGALLDCVGGSGVFKKIDLAAEGFERISVRADG